jgi:L-arabinose isomerase
VKKAEVLKAVQKEKIGILITMTDFYRQRRPDLSRKLFAEWKMRTANILQDDFDLIFPGMVHTDDEYRLAVKTCENERCKLLVILPVAYASSGAAEAALSTVSMPILIVSTAWDYNIPYDADSDILRINQAVHGVQDIANILTRRERPFNIRAGHFSDTDFVRKLNRACRVGAAASLFYSGRSGQIGGELEGMLDFSYSLDDRPSRLQFQKILLEADELVKCSGKVKKERKDEYKRWIENNFTLPPDITKEELQINAQYALGLEDLVRKHDLDAIALNFSALINDGCKTLPFFGSSKMLADGIGYGGEGDTLTALLNSAIYTINPQTTFSEFFSSDFGRNELLLSHMGECNIALAASAPITLKMRSFPWGDVVRPAVPVFQMKPGRVSICSISERPKKNGFQLIVVCGEVVASPEYPRLDVPYTKIKFSKDIGKTLEAYSLLGGNHHMVLSYGDMRDDLKLLARYCGMEYHEA